MQSAHIAIPGQRDVNMRIVRCVVDISSSALKSLGGSGSHTTSKGESSSKVEALPVVRKPIPFLHRRYRRAGRDEMHYRKR